MIKIATMSLCFAILFGCGSDKSDRNADKNRDQPLELKDRNLDNYKPAPLTAKFDDVRLQLKTFLDSFPNCPDNPYHDNCQLVKYNANKLSYNWDEKQTVLIIDAADRNGLLKYRNRIKSYLRLQANGEYLPYNYEYTIPKGVAKVFYEILGQKTFVPAHELQGFDELLNEKFGEFTKGFYVDHGNPIIATIAEYSPQSAFVVTDSMISSIQYEPKIMALLCAQKWDSYFEISKKSTESLVKVIHENNIKYINYSAGLEHQIAADIWKDVCNSTPNAEIISKMIEAETKFVKTLSNLEGVLFVQAAVGSKGNVIESPIDCIAEGYKNRIRIGAISQTKQNIPAIGLPFDAFNYEQETGRKDNQCTDAWMVGDLESRYPFNPGKHVVEWVDEIGPIPALLWTPSFAAPLALSQAIYIKESRYPQRPYDNALISDVKKDLTLGQKAVFEPVKNKTLEKYRLGY